MTGTRVTFADLTHTGQMVASNTFPLGVSLIASYAEEKLKGRIDVEVFKYPDDLNAALLKRPPKIACFANFSWNHNLSRSFARRIRERWPGTVIVFGGPNYPTKPHEQEAFLRERPEIDFHVWFEGEQAFVCLFEALEAHGFDAAALKESGEVIGSVHYIRAGRLVRGELLPRLQDLTEIPSPYQKGLNDKFFDGVLIPMLQTNRGCPFSCTFCTEGNSYYQKVRFQRGERIRSDLLYIAERASNPDLYIVDSNFGMFAQDLETCHIIADIQKRKNWPKLVGVTAGKNKKERVMEAATILNGAINLSATVQSIDDTVLENIKRKNIPIDNLVSFAKHAETLGANSYSEIILCLPGDTREAHYRSVFTMMDGDINFLRQYQLMMLPGSEMDSEESREKYAMVTRFRVLPRCFGIYDILGRECAVAEIEEICVANNTMSYEDYLDCRQLNLTIEIFYNGGVFSELIGLLKQRGFKPSDLIRRIQEMVSTPGNVLADIYEGFRAETDGSLWQDRAALEEFIADAASVRRYIAGELGSNELFKYRAIAFFHRQGDVHDIAFAAARDLLGESGGLDGQTDHYLKDLHRYGLMRKQGLLDTEYREIAHFDYDFPALEAVRFKADPLEYRVPGGIDLQIGHTPEQRDLIARYLHQYGRSVNGLGRILLRSHVNKLYRVSERISGRAESAA